MGRSLIQRHQKSDQGPMMVLHYTDSVMEGVLIFWTSVMVLIICIYHFRNAMLTSSSRTNTTRQECSLFQYPEHSYTTLYTYSLKLGIIVGICCPKVNKVTDNGLYTQGEQFLLKHTKQPIATIYKAHSPWPHPLLTAALPRPHSLTILFQRILQGCGWHAILFIVGEVKAHQCPLNYRLCFG